MLGRSKLGLQTIPQAELVPTEWPNWGLPSGIRRCGLASADTPEARCKCRRQSIYPDSAYPTIRLPEGIDPGRLYLRKPRFEHDLPLLSRSSCSTKSSVLGAFRG